MNATVRALATVGLGLTLAAANAAAVDDPPAGLIRSTTTLAQVRALVDRTHQREPGRGVEILEEWRLTADKLAGTLRVRRIGHDVRESTQLGPFVYENGNRSGTPWAQNRNGLTYVHTGFHEQRDAISERAWEAATTRWVRLLGESVAANAYVVEIDPPGGRREWRFIEKVSGNLVRRERVQKRRRYVTTYDDFRTFDGIAEPSHVRESDSFGNERELTLLARTLDLSPDPRDVEMPANRRALLEYPAAAAPPYRLPLRIVNGLPIVHVTLGARAYDFLLDSGAAGIIVDPAPIDDAKLDRFGARIASTLGTFSESSSVIPTIGIGALRMHNVVVRVVAIPFSADEHTKIAGLLGFDLFAEAVIHLDIDRSVLEVLPQGTFHPPVDAVALPLALDDRTPDVRAKVGNAYGRVVLDTGANRTVLTPAFAARAELGHDVPGSTRIRGVGGIASAEQMRVKVFELAGHALLDQTVDVSSADFDVEDVDGTIGTDLLHAFELFFDDRAGAVYIRKARRI